MHPKALLTTVLSVIALAAAACGSAAGGQYAAGSSPSPSAPAVAVSPTPVTSPVPSPVASPVATGATIAAGHTRLGTVLVDSGGRTLYLFLADSKTASRCNSAACVQYWPPVLTKGAPQAGSGINGSLLGTIRRADGGVEVTYAGHPLYYFISDKKAGDVTGQGIDSFGAPWYVVSPSGMQVG